MIPAVPHTHPTVGGKVQPRTAEKLRYGTGGVPAVVAMLNAGHAIPVVQGSDTVDALTGSK